MEFLHYILLGLVQGFTEFLPISSSAHLVLLPQILDWEDQGLAIDVAAHVGTLTAVLFYFRKEVIRMLAGQPASGQLSQSRDYRYLCQLLVATLPVAALGFLGRDIIAANFRAPLLIAAATILFGVILWIADAAGSQRRTDTDLRWRDVLIIGLAQALALVPGTSRSGITITAALFLGMDRVSASRFSFLLSIPVIALAGGYELYKMMISTQAVNWIGFLLVLVVSGMMAVLTIHYFLKFLDRTGMLPYVLYRLLLGSILIYLYI